MQVSADPKLYVVQTNPTVDRALHPDDHRPRRPRPRPDLRQRHDGLRRRAVGPALDHDRHEPRAARACAAAAAHGDLPVLPASRTRRAARRRVRLQAEAEQPRARRSAASSRTSRSSRSPTTSRRPRRCSSTGPRSSRTITRVTGPFIVEATIPPPVERCEGRRRPEAGAVSDDAGSPTACSKCCRKSPVLQLGGTDGHAQERPAAGQVALALGRGDLRRATRRSPSRSSSAPRTGR